MTDDERLKIKACLYDYENRTYGWSKILLQGLDGTLGKVFWCDIHLFRKLGSMDKYPICNWVVAFAYFKAIGYEFGCHPKETCPDSMHDHVKNSPDWRRIK